MQSVLTLQKFGLSDQINCLHPKCQHRHRAFSRKNYKLAYMKNSKSNFGVSVNDILQILKHFSRPRLQTIDLITHYKFLRCVLMLVICDVYVMNNAKKLSSKLQTTIIISSKNLLKKLLVLKKCIENFFSKLKLYMYTQVLEFPCRCQSCNTRAVL